MKFEVSVQDLQRAVNHLMGAVDSKDIDTQGRILLKTLKTDTQDKLSIASTSKGVFFTVQIPATTEIDGEAVILFEDLKTFVPKIPCWSETFGVKAFNFSKLKDSISITYTVLDTSGVASKGKFKLKYFSSLGYPVAKKIDSDVSFVLNSSIIKPAINKTSIAISKRADIRPVLKGININFDESSIYFCGTDGIIISEYRTGNTSSFKSGSFIVPSEYLKLLGRVIPSETPIFFNIGEGRIVAESSDYTLVSSLITGAAYPTYKPLFDKYDTSLVIPKEVFISNLYPMLGVLNGDDNNRLNLIINKAGIIFKTHHSEASYPIEVPQDLNYDIDINGLLLKSIIDSIQDDTLILKFTQGTNLLILDSKNFEDQLTLITLLKKR